MEWNVDGGYIGVQVPSWAGNIFNLEIAAKSKDDCDGFRGVASSKGIQAAELSSHLQGQLVAVHPA